MKTTSQPGIRLQVQPRFDARHVWEKLAQQEDLGFEVLELSVPPVLNDSCLYQMYKSWYAHSGRVSSVHGAFIDVNPASGDEALRTMSRNRCDESCRLALELGAGQVVFHSSCFPFLRGGYLEHWADVCADYYMELAQAYNLKLYIENSCDMDPVPLRALMKRISDRRIGVCLDIGHACYSRRPLDDWIDTLGEWTGYLHLSDNYGLFDDHLPLGKGIAGLEKADAWWRSTGRTVTVTLETGGPDSVRESLDYLGTHGFFGINRSRSI